jgi:hypothetical protein
MGLNDQEIVALSGERWQLVSRIACLHALSLAIVQELLWGPDAASPCGRGCVGKDISASCEQVPTLLAVPIPTAVALERSPQSTPKMGREPREAAAGLPSGAHCHVLPVSTTL